jgi:hypothetical protein
MGLAALLAVAAASAALGAPAAPAQRYLITIEGTHTFTWRTHDVRADAAGCSHVVDGRGEQTTRFRTTAPVPVSVVGGRPRGTWGARLQGSADRAGRRGDRYEGACPPEQLGDERERESDASRCGHRDFEIPLTALGPRSSDATYGFVLYLNAAVFGAGCPSFGARDGFALNAEAPLAAAKWRTAGFVLTGSGTERLDFPREGSTMVDTWSWTLRARRAG